MYRTLLARCEYRVCSHWVYIIVCHFHDSHTLLEGVWLSDIGGMAEVRYISFQRNLQLKIHLSSYLRVASAAIAPRQNRGR